MNIKPIKTTADYEAALKEIERLFEAEPGTPQGDRLEVYDNAGGTPEDKHFAIPAPDPIEAIQYFMESRDLMATRSGTLSGQPRPRVRDSESQASAIVGDDPR